MQEDHQISHVFWGIFAITVLSGFFLWTNKNGSGLWAFLFVVSGWIVSLSLHEFGHAFSAFRFGDESVASKGYLTLNPLKYTNILVSIVLPVVFLLMGGIGFPGGAVYINMENIKTAKQRSIISAAGPLATALFAVVTLLPFWFGMIDYDQHVSFWSAVTLLSFLQICALFLNLLPVPGLDGFGIIEPFLPVHLRLRFRQVAGVAFLFIFFLLFADTFVSKFFWATIAYTAYFLGLDFGLVQSGFHLFQFWNVH